MIYNTINSNEKLLGEIEKINTRLENKVNTDDIRLSDARTPMKHIHDDRYYTEPEIDLTMAQINTRLGKSMRYIGVYEQEITLAGGGTFFQAIPSQYQNGGYFYFINCSGNSLNFSANMEGYNMAVRNLSTDTLTTRVQVYLLSVGV